MSTKNRFRDDSHGTLHKATAHTRRPHPFRVVLWVSLLVAALVLWQLPAVTQGLSGASHALQHAEGFRHYVAGLLSIGYHRVLLWVHRTPTP
ncbi:MAG: hypothetical protein OWQ57_10900 [Sulfobacillus sp.]|nr:hypothetical protein [Sulfobacillus sp.]